MQIKKARMEIRKTLRNTLLAKLKVLKSELAKKIEAERQSV